MRDESSDKRVQATMAMNEGFYTSVFHFLFEISYLPYMAARAATHFVLLQLIFWCEFV